MNNGIIKCATIVRKEERNNTVDFQTEKSRLN